MHYAKVIGTVVATQKTEQLKGYPLKVLQACNNQGEPQGDQFIAIDPISTRPGDHVLWVSKREASLAIEEAPLANLFAVDAAITGIIDDIG